MHTTTERIMVSRPIHLAIRSWIGGPRFVAPTGNRVSSSGDQQGSPPSLSLSHGGARSSVRGRTASRLTASIPLRILIVFSWKQSTTSRSVPWPQSPCCCPKLHLLPLLSHVSERAQEKCWRGRESDMGKLGREVTSPGKVVLVFLEPFNFRSFTFAFLRTF